MPPSWRLLWAGLVLRSAPTSLAPVPTRFTLDFVGDGLRLGGVLVSPDGSLFALTTFDGIHIRPAGEASYRLLPNTERAMMIFMQGMKLAGAGIVIGLLAAAAMGRLLTSLLYGVSAFDPLTLVGGSVVFLIAAALAGLIPAQRAARTLPAVALRSN